MVTMLQVTLLCLLLGSSLTVSRHIIDKNEDFSGKNTTDPRELDIAMGDGRAKNITDENENSSGNEEDELGVYELLKRANNNLGNSPNGPKLSELDIVVGDWLQNSSPCTASSCKWPKASDGKVYVPYRISQHYSQQEKKIIEDGLRSFSEPKSRPLTCILFIPRTNQTDFLDIKPLNGCWSKVGKQNGAQVVSLAQSGCLYKKIIQHEVMHALGFKHEQSRSDRDQHIAIQWQNDWPLFKFGNTMNTATLYDYSSIMHYERIENQYISETRPGFLNGVRAHMAGQSNEQQRHPAHQQILQMQMKRTGEM